MSHTSGEWVLDGDDHGHGGDVCGKFIAHKDGGRIAEAFMNCLVTTEDECRANARLISAAPDLLAALYGVLRVADRATNEFDAARAAIAKATGGQQ